VRAPPGRGSSGKDIVAFNCGDQAEAPPTGLRSQTRADREERFCAQRRGAVHSNAGPHDRSLLGADRSSRRGRAHHRRHDPLADPGTLSRARHACRLRLPAGGKDAASGVRPTLRGTYLDVRDALPRELGMGGEYQNFHPRPVRPRVFLPLPSSAIIG